MINETKDERIHRIRNENIEKWLNEEIYEYQLTDQIRVSRGEKVPHVEMYFDPFPF